MTTSVASPPSAHQLGPIGSYLGDLNEITQVAAYLRCGRTQVFNLIRTGELASLKVGRRRLVPRDSILAYVDRLRSLQSGR